MTPLSQTRPWRPMSPLKWPGQPQSRLLQPWNAQPLRHNNAPPRPGKPNGLDKPVWHYDLQNCPSRDEWGNKVCPPRKQLFVDHLPRISKPMWQEAWGSCQPQAGNLDHHQGHRLSKTHCWAVQEGEEAQYRAWPESIPLPLPSTIPLEYQPSNQAAAADQSSGRTPQLPMVRHA